MNHRKGQTYFNIHTQSEWYVQKVTADYIGLVELTTGQQFTATIEDFELAIDNGLWYPQIESTGDASMDEILEDLRSWDPPVISGFSRHVEEIMNNEGDTRCPYCYGVLDGKYCPNGCGKSDGSDHQTDDDYRLEPFEKFLEGLE